uniref:Retrotransposon gag domain-containing protein n=1 Tax=Phlebotomus papatasi TaxID=29031 RepID=A0A1B0DMF7_PHLPP
MTSTGSTERIGPTGFVGHIEPYVPGDDFVICIERLEKIFLINQVESEQLKHGYLVGFIGQEAYKVLKSTLHLHTVDSRTYEQSVEVLKAKYAPKKSVIAERFKFYKREQENGESIRDYVVELQILAETCKFGDFLSSALRDKFVMGLQDSHVQIKLLSLDQGFEESVKVAMASELASNSVDAMKPRVDALKRGHQRDFGSSTSLKRRQRERNFPGWPHPC